jgi:wyosine [tRNA(Phe)-imidazoG37] synthetase (radical SAM superfamily)
MFTYGPVPSRRLGRSLGVSPIPPKTCSYSCVYCQLGRTKYLQIQRNSFYPKREIFSEIQKRSRKSKPDYITFVGDGEPTLCKDLGWLIRLTKQEIKLPAAVIPSLDAATEKTFRHINRPHGDISFNNVFKGLNNFRAEFSGQIWLEIMLVRGLNDSGVELMKIKQAIDMVKPDRVYLASPIRPPAEQWVVPAAPETIVKAQKILGSAEKITEKESGEFGVGEFTDARQAIMEICSRHPLRLDQAVTIERSFSMTGSVGQLIEEGRIIEVHYNDEQYLLPRYFIREKHKNPVGR